MAGQDRPELSQHLVEQRADLHGLGRTCHPSFDRRPVSRKCRTEASSEAMVTPSESIRLSWRVSGRASLRLTRVEVSPWMMVSDVRSSWLTVVTTCSFSASRESFSAATTSSDRRLTTPMVAAQPTTAPAPTTATTVRHVGSGPGPKP